MFTLSINIEDADDVTHLATIADVMKNQVKASSRPSNVLESTSWYLTQLVDFVYSDNKEGLFDSMDIGTLIEYLKRTTSELENILGECKAA